MPADMTGLTAIELGCGTGYVSAWMTRRGATVTAIDNSERQLETARRLAAEHGLQITWLHGNAEQVPRAAEVGPPGTGHVPRIRGAGRASPTVSSRE